jgi:hypothetical protein
MTAHIEANAGPPPWPAIAVFEIFSALEPRAHPDADSALKRSK